MLPQLTKRITIATTTFVGITYAFTQRSNLTTTNEHVLPNGYPRSCCCDTSLFASKDAHCQSISPPTHPSTSNQSTSSLPQNDLVQQLQSIVGIQNVYPSGDTNQNIYLKGARLGQGTAVAVCRPGNLQQAVDSLRAIVDANAIVIPQGANTGLTGGSVPRNEIQRTKVVLNMRRLNQIIELNTHDINKDPKFLCLAGAGIHTLSERAKSINRESHSILGSTFLNPTVAAGVSLGSGGSQMRKGPVYTERALWCSIENDGTVQIHNTLGIGTEMNDKDLLNTIDQGNFVETNTTTTTAATTPPPPPPPSPPPPLPPASDAISYCKSLCQINDQVSRYNADTRGIDPVRSEGKVLILASIHDTFPVPKKVKNIWISVKSLLKAQQLKQEVLLSNPNDLPISCEYMNQDTIQVVSEGGRFLCHSLLTFGIGPKFEYLWDVKNKIESFHTMFENLPDQIMSILNDFLPRVLPVSVSSLSKKYNHHMLVTVGDFGTGEIDRFNERLDKFIQQENEEVAVLTLDAKDAKRVGIFRFAAAPAFRTWCVGRGVQGLSLDYALPKNHVTVPTVDNGVTPVVRCRYSHFGCNVVHEDVAYEAGVDVHACKMATKKIVEEELGKLPAEHGHGTEYEAPKETQERWMRMDVTNSFNPGIGGLNLEKYYGRKS